jgi:hypothetical protein
VWERSFEKQLHARLGQTICMWAHCSSTSKKAICYSAAIRSVRAQSVRKCEVDAELSREADAQWIPMRAQKLFLSFRSAAGLVVKPNKQSFKNEMIVSLQNPIQLTA